MLPPVVEDRFRWLYRTRVKDRAGHGRRTATLDALRQSKVPQAFTVAETLEKTYGRRFCAEERRRLDRIGALRDRCEASTEQLDYVDYGAGDPDAPTEMQKAREGVKRTIALERLARHTSKAPPWSDLIFNLVRGLRPERCLELGTCIGLSAAYQCSAMALNGKGRLITLEGDEGFAKRAGLHLRSLELSQYEIVVGPFERTLSGVLNEFAPFDFMFNDGHHDGAAMLQYFERSLPSFREDAVLLFDDINNYESMKRAWKELCSHERVALAVDFGPMGLVCLGSGRNAPRVLDFRM